MIEFESSFKAAPHIDTITVGGVDEALCYAAENAPAWLEDEAAMEWLMERMRQGGATKQQITETRHAVQLGRGAVERWKQIIEMRFRRKEK